MLSQWEVVEALRQRLLDNEEEIEHEEYDRNMSIVVRTDYARPSVRCEGGDRGQCSE